MDVQGEALVCRGGGEAFVLVSCARVQEHSGVADGPTAMRLIRQRLLHFFRCGPAAGGRATPFALSRIGGGHEVQVVTCVTQQKCPPFPKDVSTRTLNGVYPLTDKQIKAFALEYAKGNHPPLHNIDICTLRPSPAPMRTQA